MFATTPVLDRDRQLTRDEIVQRWIQHARNASGNEQRNHRRFPLFQPITIQSGASEQSSTAAFTRDISRLAIGLVHSDPLQTQRITLQLTRPRIDVTVDIQRCRPYHGWHISHGLFVDLSASNFAKLALATATQSVNLRLAQRYPFFRPVKLTVLPNLTRIPAVFCRDISTTGIGLFHNTPLEKQQVLLRIESDDPLEAVQARIRWCRPCQNGWYLSGASFDKMLMERLEF